MPAIKKNKLTSQYSLNEQYDEISLFADFKADVEQSLPMIYQSGYLTIKGYDRYTHPYWLDFPNNEVRRGFLSLKL